ncbi:transcription initiation factor TFIID subunit 7 [Tanacetum coccineum]|uniref:Transcription initiation factor TFIID subunit 7 n=1 Tax=Tanacetum coccineum TaxID=301880 RepID=A0ABQ5A618_9ASTR
MPLRWWLRRSGGCGCGGGCGCSGESGGVTWIMWVHISNQKIDAVVVAGLSITLLMLLAAKAKVGADRVLACDLHSGQSMGYFDILVDYVYCQVMNLIGDVKDKDNGRRGTFTIGDDQFPASLFDLPCIVESHKTYDDSVLIKTADVGQGIAFLSYSSFRNERDPATEVVEYRLYGLNTSNKRCSKAKISQGA